MAVTLQHRRLPRPWPHEAAQLAREKGLPFVVVVHNKERKADATAADFAAEAWKLHDKAGKMFLGASVGCAFFGGG